MTQYTKIHNVFPAEYSLFTVQSITPNRSHMQKAINLITINGKSTSGMVQQIFVSFNCKCFTTEIFLLCNYNTIIGSCGQTVKVFPTQ